MSILQPNCVIMIDLILLSHERFYFLSEELQKKHKVLMSWDTRKANQSEEQFLRFMKLWYYFNFNKI